MPRPVPPQVIPRPPDWRLGDPAPWAGLLPAARRDITLSRVGAALAACGQSGPVPDDIGAGGVLGPSISINEAHVPAERVINAAVLAVFFGGAGGTRLI